MKIIARECHNQKDCQGVSLSKGLPGSATIKRTARECNNQMGSRECLNQKDCMGVPQSKGLSGSVTIKMTATIKTTTGYATIKTTARERHYQK